MKKILFFTLISLFTIGCTHTPTPEERAQNYLDSAAILKTENHLEAAKILLDSVHAQFPKLVKYRRQADTLAWNIELLEIDRNLRYVDSLLPEKVAEVNAQTKKFKHEKDDKFQQYGTFTYNVLRTEWNIGRSYIKPHTDEIGRLYITAHYCGKPIDYDRLRLSTGEMFTETLPIDINDKHTFNDLGTTHETALFAPEKLGTLPDFWSMKHEGKVKVTFIGKRNYHYILTKEELDAFVATYRLATDLADVYKLEELQRRSLIRQEILRKKLSQKQ